ncbi:MAG: gluconolaconase [Sphingomonas sp. 28-66-16]|nr:MAG: gluconolaconase [Sphingomonas sp. 28-66-16]
MRATSVLAVGTMLGEGPVWIEGALWFVDIKGRLIHRFDPATGDARRWETPDQIGWILPAASSEMIVGLRTGVHRFDPASGTYDQLHDPEPHSPGSRLNDATTDTAGRLWFGTMDDDERANTGRLYRCDNGRCVDTGAAPVAITNGPSISADRRTLYHTDTLAKTIWRLPIDPAGHLGKPERHIVIEEGAGHPDGSVLDAEGCLWTGLYGGWSVRRYDPAGKFMASVPFPVANVTKIAFGGDGLRTAFATTARKGLDAAALADQPEAGDLFAFDPGVAGLPVVAARI